MQNIKDAKQEIIKASDQCVLCGLCLPHCPTYRTTKIESESPRGRIALVRALKEEKLHPNANLVHHLDNCLTCMNCQSVCPANVNYEKIIEAGREIIKSYHSLSQKIKRQFILIILTNVYVRVFIQSSIRINHLLGIHKLLNIVSNKLPYSLRAISLIPNLEKFSFTSSTVTNTYNKTRVMLISTCANDLFLDQTKNAAKFVLSHLNCEVISPKITRCCGALHQHEGYIDTAHILMNKFLLSLTSSNIDAFIPIATGCGAHLNRLPDLTHEKRAQEIVNKQFDINSFVAEKIVSKTLKFKPLPKEVWIHQPCTQMRLTNDPDTVENLLGKIPQVQIKTFQDDISCCGAGGMNTIMQAKLADELIENKICEITSSNASYLVSSNIGCALHFQSLLKRRKSNISVCHPITLMAQQLIYS